jgi:hypothetical protein
MTFAERVAVAHEAFAMQLADAYEASTYAARKESIGYLVRILILAMVACNEVLDADDADWASTHLAMGTKQWIGDQVYGALRDVELSCGRLGAFAREAGG